jgi:hypothetical protein
LLLVDFGLRVFAAAGAIAVALEVVLATIDVDDDAVALEDRRVIVPAGGGGRSR